jgi:hypothetical protein
MNLRETVVANDLRIMDVATYVSTKGNMLDVKDIKDSPDKMNELQDNITKVFKDFKQRIRSGKFTLAELEEREYGKWGILEEVPVTLPASNPFAQMFGGTKDLPNLDKKDPENHIGF